MNITGGMNITFDSLVPVIQRVTLLLAKTDFITILDSGQSVDWLTSLRVSYMNR